MYREELQNGGVYPASWRLLIKAAPTHQGGAYSSKMAPTAVARSAGRQQQHDMQNLFDEPFGGRDRCDAPALGFVWQQQAAAPPARLRGCLGPSTGCGWGDLQSTREQSTVREWTTFVESSMTLRV